MFKSIELVKSDSKHMINKLGCYVQKKILIYDLRLCIIIDLAIFVYII